MARVARQVERIVVAFWQLSVEDFMLSKCNKNVNEKFIVTLCKTAILLNLAGMRFLQEKK
jgi:hypothetical protein